MAHRPKPSPNSQSSSNGHVLSSTDIITSAESPPQPAAARRLEEDLLGMMVRQTPTTESTISGPWIISDLPQNINHIRSSSAAW